jgi:putative transcriptional regulator
MKQPENAPEAISGSLLLAAPSLRDPNFFHTVLLLAAHNSEDGAFGYILNRPLDKQVSDLLEDRDLGPLGDVPVFLGGPVGTNKLSFAALDWNNKKRSLQVQTHLSTEQAIKELKKGRIVRGFVGYSGWSKGQIESEIKHRSWIVTPSRKTILTTQPVTQMWTAVLEEMGPVYQLMAHTPEKVELN